MTYARLLHDHQREDMHFRPRSKSPTWKGRPHPPETVRFFEERDGRFTKGKSVKLTPLMDKLTLTINGKRAYKAITNPPAGWINDGDNPELLSFGGNLVDLDRQEGDYYRVRALAYNSIPPGDLSYTAHPEYIHKFNGVKKNGGFIKLGFGINAFIPLLKKTGIWLHKSQIELFPEIIPGGLPVIVTARGSMFAMGDLHVRMHPNSSAYVLGALNFGDPVRILGYFCSAGDVWASTNFDGKAGFICLQRQSGYRIEFFTTWKMDTQPPLA